MALDDKIKNAVEDLGGKAKEAAGKVTNDGSLEAEGKSEQAAVKIKQAGKDVFH